MAQRDAGETDLDVAAGTADQERGLARIVAGGAGNLRRQRGDVGQQRVEFARGVGIVQRGDKFDRLLQLFEVGGKLGLEGGIQHGGLHRGADFG